MYGFFMQLASYFGSLNGIIKYKKCMHRFSIGLVYFVVYKVIDFM